MWYTNRYDEERCICEDCREREYIELITSKKEPIKLYEDRIDIISICLKLASLNGLLGGYFDCENSVHIVSVQELLHEIVDVINKRSDLYQLHLYENELEVIKEVLYSVVETPKYLNDLCECLRDDPTNLDDLFDLQAELHFIIGEIEKVLED